jgi:hypothetical protein
MLVGDYASVEAEVDRREPSRLQIDIRLHPMSVGALNPDAGEIQRAIREGFRDALREAQLERLVLASNPQKRRGWFARVLGFVVCVGLGAMATLVLTAYHPRPSAVAGLEDLGSPVATLGRNRANPPSQPPPNRPLPGRRERAGSRDIGSSAITEDTPMNQQQTLSWPESGRQGFARTRLLKIRRPRAADEIEQRTGMTGATGRR